MHPYPKHLDGFDYRGCHRYFLTLCTYERQRLFTERAHVALVESHFLRTARELHFADLAHCFMPDHLHALVEGRAPHADARVFIRRVKQYSGFYSKQAFGVQLWQRYGFERVLREGEPMRDVLRYILENPVRARLVTNVADYPYFGSSEYSIEGLLEFCSGGGSSG